MFLLEDSTKNTWHTIGRYVDPNGIEYSIRYCVGTDGYLSMRCNRNGAELYIKLEDLYNCIKYIKLLLEKGFVNEGINDERNIATNWHYNTEIFKESFGDEPGYFHGNNWWEKDLIAVMEFLIANSSKEVIKNYTGDKLKKELKKLSVNCLGEILKEVENEKSL